MTGTPTGLPNTRAQAAADTDTGTDTGTGTGTDTDTGTEALVLDGIRVVDLSWGLPGPVATQILADAGADVIKVEPPSGDPVRDLYPGAFASWNRGKRSVVLHLDDPRLLGLLATADVLVHSLRPGDARRHGLDEATLAGRFPRLVVCGITGYPRGHADAERPGHDLLVQAREGLMDVQLGWKDGPFAWRFFLPSWGAAFLAATGIAARLFHRARGDNRSADGRGGRGGAAHTSLAQGAHLILNMLWSHSEKPSPSLTEGQPGTLVARQAALYECRDGAWIQILNPGDRIDLSVLPVVKEVLAELGREGEALSADLLGEVMTHRDSAEWIRQIRAVDVAVELVAPLGEVLRYPDVVANGFSTRVDDPVFGATLQASPPFRGDRGWRIQRPAPRLGEHDDLLDDLPCSSASASAPASPAATGEPAATSDGGHPLAGVRVVDFGAFLAGPLAPMMFADLGADVIKVEPVRGDPVRGWRDGFFVACNRGKRGIALDITAAVARPVVDRLVGWADVVHHNIRARSAARLRLDGPAIHALNPSAVYGHVSAYGLNGPMADAPGFDSVFQSIAGWQVANAGAGNPPLFVHFGNLDALTGLSSAAATVLALYHRERTGETTSCEAALLNTAAFTASEVLLRLDRDELSPAPALDQGQTGLGPGYRIYRTADGWVAVAALGRDQLDALRRVAGARPLTDRAGAAAPADVAAPAAPADTADTADTADLADLADLADRLATRAGAELVEALGAAGVDAEIVREFRYFTVFADEENLRTRTVVSYPQPDWGEMRQFGAYWDFGDLDLRLDRACPAVGQHSVEVLTELGLSAEEIEALVAAGAVGGQGA